jgi:hypothetical protein
MPALLVLARLDPAIHLKKMMDALVKPAHDGGDKIAIADQSDEQSRKNQPLCDPAYFARVFLEDCAPTWPNGFDMCPDWLRRETESAER